MLQTPALVTAYRPELDLLCAVSSAQRNSRLTSMVKIIATGVQRRSPRRLLASSGYLLLTGRAAPANRLPMFRSQSPRLYPPPPNGIANDRTHPWGTSAVVDPASPLATALITRPTVHRQSHRLVRANRRWAASGFGPQDRRILRMPFMETVTTSHL